MITVDLHIHTNHSHGQASVEEMFVAAKHKGLTVIGFSEHSPRPQGYAYAKDYQNHLMATFPQYMESIQCLKQKNTEKLDILLGLEMDWIEAEEAFIRQHKANWSLDYCLGGIHFLGTWGFDATGADWDLKSQEECFALYDAYFATFVKMAESKICNIAAHPDIIKIFSIQHFHQWIQLPASLKTVQKAVESLKDTNMAMEISSAGLRRPCKEIYPGPEFMALAAKYQVPITFASDAHCVNTPAFGFDTLARYAQSFGYSESVWFQNNIFHSRSF